MLEDAAVMVHTPYCSNFGVYAAIFPVTEYRSVTDVIQVRLFVTEISLVTKNPIVAFEFVILAVGKCLHLSLFVLLLGSHV